MKADPQHLEVFKDYVRNLASWLQSAPVTMPERLARA